MTRIVRFAPAPIAAEPDCNVPSALSEALDCCVDSVPSPDATFQAANVTSLAPLKTHGELPPATAAAYRLLLRVPKLTGLIVPVVTKVVTPLMMLFSMFTRDPLAMVTASEFATPDPMNVSL